MVASQEMTRQREMLASFARTAAHDLRSPITGIAQFTDQLLEGGTPFDDHTAELMNVVYQAAREATGMIDRTLSRALSERTQSSVTADLIDVVSRVRDLLAPSHRVSHCHLRPVYGDSGALPLSPPARGRSFSERA